MGSAFDEFTFEAFILDTVLSVTMELDTSTVDDLEAVAVDAVELLFLLAAVPLILVFLLASGLLTGVFFVTAVCCPVCVPLPGGFFAEADFTGTALTGVAFFGLAAAFAFVLPASFLPAGADFFTADLLEPLVAGLVALFADSLAKPFTGAFPLVLLAAFPETLLDAFTAFFFNAVFVTGLAEAFVAGFLPAETGAAFLADLAAVFALGAGCAFFAAVAALAGAAFLTALLAAVFNGAAFRTTFCTAVFGSTAPGFCFDLCFTAVLAFCFTAALDAAFATAFDFAVFLIAISGSLLSFKNNSCQCPCMA